MPPNDSRRVTNIMDSIPSSQRAVVVQSPGNNYEMIIRDDIPVRTPGADEILVKLSCTGLW